MSIHIVGMSGLFLIFLISALRPVNPGMLALVTTFLVGTSGQRLTGAAAVGRLRRCGTDDVIWGDNLMRLPLTESGRVQIE